MRRLAAGLKIALPVATLIGATVLTCMLMTSAGCASTATHPGALSRFDSQAYDSLMIAQATIIDARAQAEAGELTQAQKDLLNKVIVAYNGAMDTYVAYHNALKVWVDLGGGNEASRPSSAVIAADVAQLVADVAELVETVKAGRAKGGAQ